MKKIKKLEMVDISKTFRSLRANSKVSLEIGEGEILGLLGENGRGKKTRMQII